jgi:serine/threonine protein kinase
LRAKYTSTSFNNISQWKTSHSSRQVLNNGFGGHQILDHREDWKRIAGGWEGEIFVYNDTVIKTFVASRSPMRNCLKFTRVPTRIPTEILVALWLGGLGSEIHEVTEYMPVHGYFRTPATETGLASWYFLTPYLESGSLKDLAKRLRPSGLTYRQLDLRFRPSLNRLLSALEKMHDEHHLCHDDIKQGNIFVAGTPSMSDSRFEDNGNGFTHWILADFSNVRQVSHAYHSSLIWAMDSRQHRDCRINDAVRLMNTYPAFLRTASAGDDLVTFDEAFWSGGERWSELYWSAVGKTLLGAMAAKVLRDKSLSLPPVAIDGFMVSNIGSRWFLCLPRSSCKVGNTGELDRGMRVTEDRARFFAGTAIFGVPQGQCQGLS